MDRYKELQYISILYVEDDELSSELMREYLESYIGKIYSASNGEEGLRIYHELSPDLIVTDISLPVMNGLDMSAAIRKVDRDIPIIINSAFNERHLLLRAITIGVNDYILKPITDTTKVLESIYRHMQHRVAFSVFQAHKKLMQSIVNEIYDPLFLLGLDHHITLLNSSAQTMLDQHICYIQKGYNLQTLADKINKEHELLIQATLNEKKAHTTTYICKDQNQNQHFFDITFKPIVDQDNCVNFILMMLHDVTNHISMQQALEKKTQHLKYLAHYDTLTSLPNREYLIESLKSEMEAKSAFALMFIDLDNFKYTNDQYGHDMGDALLVEVSKRLKSVIRQSDIVARFGGDEFCVVIKHLSDKEIAKSIAQKINDTLTHYFWIDNYKLTLSCSIGISIYPQDGVCVKELLKHADIAMYSIKTNGKNSYEFYQNGIESSSQIAI